MFFLVNNDGEHSMHGAYELGFTKSEHGFPESLHRISQKYRAFPSDITPQMS